MKQLDYLKSGLTKFFKAKGKKGGNIEESVAHEMQNIFRSEKLTNMWYKLTEENIK